jgi:hypothetical protein
MGTHITIETAAGEFTLAELGLEDPVLEKRNAVPSTFSVAQVAAFDGTPQFAYGAAIKVRIGRERNATSGPFTGGTKIFSGTRVMNPVDATGQREGMVFTFADAWHRLERITYGQQWATWTRRLPLVPVAYDRSYIECSDVNLYTRVNSDDNTVARISNGEQISDAVEWAIDHGVSLQIGTITPAMYIPPDFKTDLKVAEVIRMALKFCPDAVCEIDESTEPPTFNVVQRSSMTDAQRVQLFGTGDGRVSIDLGEERIEALNLVRRDDLVVPAVVLKYRRVDEIDGVSKYLAPLVDAAPETATGFEENALMQTIQLFGAKVSNVYGEIVSEEIPDDLTDPEWWAERGNDWLSSASISEIEIIPAGREGELPFVLLPESAGIMPWMRDDEGDAAESATETFRAQVRYVITETGEQTEWREISVRLRTTNLASGVYSTRESEEGGEVAVAGLAAQLLAALSVVHHDGEVTVTEQECLADVRLVNVLNVAGGTGRFAAMDAIPQSITWRLASGTRTIQLGWPRHLSVDDIIEVGRFNRTRRIWNNPDLQATGEAAADDDLELPGDGPMEDVANGPEKSNVVVAQGAGTGQVPSVRLNGTTGAIQMWHTENGEGGGSATGGGGGMLNLRLDDTGGREIKLREMPVLVRVNGQCVQKRIIMACSPIFD